MTIAAYPTTQDIMTTAVRTLGVMAAIDATPNAEDNALALTVLNQIIGQANTRKRISAFFQQSQEFTFASTKQIYTIGAAGSGADFIVQQGERPNKIDYARVVLNNSSPPVYIEMAVINTEQNIDITVPQLTSNYPTTLYYKPDWPKGQIVVWPEPTTTSYKLELTWWQQLIRVDMASVGAAIKAPNGYDRYLSLKLAVALYPMFPKRSDLPEILRQMREAESDISSVNVQPPKIDTTDGVQSQSGSSWDWRSRSFTS